MLRENLRRTPEGYVHLSCYLLMTKDNALGIKEIARQSFAVLQSLLNVFSIPVLWFGIIPSAASELAAYLTQTGQISFLHVPRSYSMNRKNGGEQRCCITVVEDDSRCCASVFIIDHPGAC